MGIKIVLVDDDSLIRESFKIMLSYDEHIEIMKVFGDGMDAIEYCSKGGYSTFRCKDAKNKWYPSY